MNGQLRRCSLCWRLKPLTDYWWDDKEHTRLGSRCKQCKNRITRERRAWERPKQYPFKILKPAQVKPPRFAAHGSELCEVCGNMVECRTRVTHQMPVLCELTDTQDLLLANVIWPGEGMERLGL